MRPPEISHFLLSDRVLLEGGPLQFWALVEGIGAVRNVVNDLNVGCRCFQNVWIKCYDLRHYWSCLLLVHLCAPTGVYIALSPGGITCRRWVHSDWNWKASMR